MWFLIISFKNICLDVTWIKAGIKSFVLSRGYKVNSCSPPLSPAVWSFAIAHSKYFFRLYRSDKSDSNTCLFVLARNMYKPVLNEAKLIFAERMKQHITSRQFDSKYYWRLCKGVLNNNKYAIRPLVNQFEILTYSGGKAACFTRKFSFHWKLDWSGVLTPDFLHRIETLLNEMSIPHLIGHH